MILLGLSLIQNDFIVLIRAHKTINIEMFFYYLLSTNLQLTRFVGVYEYYELIK